MKQKLFILVVAGLTLGGLVFGMLFYRDEISKVFAGVGEIHNYFQNALVLGGSDRSPGAILDVDGNILVKGNITIPNIKSAGCLGTDSNGNIIVGTKCGSTNAVNPICGTATSGGVDSLSSASPDLCIGWSASNFMYDKYGEKYSWNCGPSYCETLKKTNGECVPKTNQNYDGQYYNSNYVYDSIGCKSGDWKIESCTEYETYLLAEFVCKGRNGGYNEYCGKLKDTLNRCYDASYLINP